MRVAKFTLSGKTAFFKRPDVNTYFYFSYGHIHKVALLGILGSIIGLGGYTHMSLLSEKKKTIYPEFYKELKDLEIAIIPNKKNGVISKKIITFNNSVGYASEEKGGNLVVNEQWLYNPSWDIYIMLNSERANQIAEYLIERKAVFIPYLGKNDHIADIENVEIIEALGCDKVDRIDSFFLKSDAKLQTATISFDDEPVESVYKYEEVMPIAIDETLNNYIFSTFIKTNQKLEISKDIKLYTVEDKIIRFI